MSLGSQSKSSLNSINCNVKDVACSFGSVAPILTTLVFRQSEFSSIPLQGWDAISTALGPRLSEWTVFPYSVYGVAPIERNIFEQHVDPLSLPLSHEASKISGIGDR